LAWIDKNGGDWKSIKIFELPYAAVIPAIEEGRISAGMLNEPSLSQALDGGRVRILARPQEALGRRFISSAWFATASYVAANLDIVSRFASVVREASGYANTHQAQTVDLSAAFTHVDRAIVERSARVTFAQALDPALIQPVVDAAVRYRVIERTFDARELIAQLR